MAPNCDSRTLYTLVTGSNLNDVYDGFRRLGECLLPIARHQLNSNQYDDMIVEDCVQEALESIWDNLEKGNHPNSPDTFWTWTSRITINKCIDRVRYEKRRPSESLTVLTDEIAIQLLRAILPNDSVIRTIDSLNLFLSIQNHPKLSENSKTIIINGYLFEMTDVELAHALSKSRSTIRGTRRRNLTKLRKDDAFMATLQP